MERSVSSDDVVSFVQAGGFRRVWLSHEPGDTSYLSGLVGCLIIGQLTVRAEPWTVKPLPFFDLVIYFDSRNGRKALLHGGLHNEHVVAIRLVS